MKEARIGQKVEWNGAAYTVERVLDAKAATLIAEDGHRAHNVPVADLAAVKEGK